MHPRQFKPSLKWSILTSPSLSHFLLLPPRPQSLLLPIFCVHLVPDTLLRETPVHQSSGFFALFVLLIALFALVSLFRVCRCAQANVEAVLGREVCGSSPLHDWHFGLSNHGRVPPTVVHARLGRRVQSAPVRASSLGTSDLSLETPRAGTYLGTTQHSSVVTHYYVSTLAVTRCCNTLVLRLHSVGSVAENCFSSCRLPPPICVRTCVHARTHPHTYALTIGPVFLC